MPRLELLLAAAHRGQRTATAVTVGQRGGHGQLAAATLLVGLALCRAGDLGRGDAARRKGCRRTSATSTSTPTARTHRLVLVRNHGIGGRGGSATARVFLGALACLRLALQPRFLLSLPAGGFLALLLAALFFVGAAARFLGGLLAVLRLARLRSCKRTAACFHLVARQLVQDHARPFRCGGRPRTRRLDDDRLRHDGGSRRLRHEHRRRRRRLLAGQREFPLLGFDDDLLRAAMREVLAHRALRHAGRLEAQSLLHIDAQRLVVV
jgi:hypothetical protein